MYRGTADRTKSGMRKNKLKENRKGRIVSKKKSEAAKKQWERQMRDPEFRRKWEFMKAKKSEKKFRKRGENDKDNLKGMIATAEDLSGGAKDCEVGRRMIVCVRKSNKKKPCKDGKRRVDGRRCSPGRKTLCKDKDGNIKPNQYRRKVSKGKNEGKFVCVDKKKRKLPPCKDGKRRIQGKPPCVPGRKTKCNKEGQIRRKVSKGKNKGKYVCADPKKRKSSKRKKESAAKKKSKKKKSKKKKSTGRRVSTRSQARRTRSGKRLINV